MSPEATDDVFVVVQNPVEQKELKFKINKDFSSGKLSVFDVTGKEIYQYSFIPSEEFSFTMNSLNLGVYLVEVELDNIAYKKKVLFK